jgi:type VI secretion system protein ImpA
MVVPNTVISTALKSSQKIRLPEYLLPQNSDVLRVRISLVFSDTDMQVNQTANRQFFMNDLSAITFPVEDDNPCGCFIRESGSGSDLYTELRDQRLVARRIERDLDFFRNEEFGRQWHRISAGCIATLAETSKDIDVLCWLIEAQLRIRGFPGLAETITAVNAVVEHYWEGLHPVDCESVEERVAPFASLDGREGAGGFLQALRLAPLVPEKAFGEFCLWNYLKTRRDGDPDLRAEIVEAARQAGRQAMIAHLDAINRCLVELRRLDGNFRRCCGDDAPRTTASDSLLREAASIVQEINFSLGIGVADAAVPSATVVGQDGMPQTPGDGPPLCEPFRSREEALDMLLRIAGYFQRAEPNSPLGAALESLWRRSRLNFAELLEDLMPDPDMCAAVLTAAGISVRSHSSED